MRWIIFYLWFVFSESSRIRNIIKGLQPNSPNRAISAAPYLTNVLYYRANHNTVLREDLPEFYTAAILGHYIIGVVLGRHKYLFPFIHYINNEWERVKVDIKKEMEITELSTEDGHIIENFYKPWSGATHAAQRPDPLPLRGRYWFDNWLDVIISSCMC